MEILPGLRRIILTPRAIKRERELSTEYATKVKPSGWQTTDPLNHDPGNFRYIVHVTTKKAIDNTIWLRTAERGKSGEQYTDRGWQETLADFLSQNSISCTLVDELHRGTYKPDVIPHGFILEVPEENIVAIDPTDLGAHNHVQNRQEREQQIFFQHGVEIKRNTPSAQAFLESCRRDFRNELLIDGIGPEGKQIRIAGVFLLTDPILGSPLPELYSRLSWSPRAMYHRLFSPGYWAEENYEINRLKRQYKTIKDLAQLLQIPIIRIPAPL
ncbi:MAG: hypothetical protein Q7R77_00090 [Candidatus Daviesbacteria bacterium]|nr:hypothetical protein [Candidatus Daviesbacteria bacterium]